MTTTTNTRPIWIITTIMLVILWLVFPLSNLFTLIKTQHCLLTIAHVSHTSTVELIEHEVTQTFRGYPIYHIELYWKTEGMAFRYQGEDKWFDASIYNISQLSGHLKQYQIGDEIQVNWTQNLVFTGQEPIIISIDEQSFGECSWWAIAGQAVQILFVTTITVAVVWVLRTVLSAAKSGLE